MAGKKKQVVEKDPIAVEVEETTKAAEIVGAEEQVAEGSTPKDGDAPIPGKHVLSEAQEPGTIIKKYVQNGIKYNRVVQSDGVSTLDIKA